MRKHALKDLTFVELRERLAERPVVILPLGSQEEQGPQAPMGDYMLTERIAAMAAEAADALVAPIMPFGYADFFKPVPGGIQLRSSTFEAVLEDMVTAFLDHGIEHVLILNGHSSNAPLIDQTLRRLRKSSGIAIPCINLWRSIPDSLWRELHGENAAKARGHGGEPLTSVYMHLFPELLRPELAKPSKPSPAFGLPTAGVGAVTFEGIQVQMPLEVTEVNADGMIGGDASFARAEIGRAITAHLVGFTARFIAHFRGCDPRDVAAGPK